MCALSYFMGRKLQKVDNHLCKQKTPLRTLLRHGKYANTARHSNPKVNCQFFIRQFLQTTLGTTLSLVLETGRQTSGSDWMQFTGFVHLY